jgi:hypothetical protein
MHLIRLISRRFAVAGIPAVGFRKPDPDLSDRFDKARPLAFMHIPKTSGSAITSGLTAALEAPSVVVGYDHSVFGSYRHLDSIDASIRCRIYDSPACMPQNADLVVGHLAFSTLRDAYPRAQRLTLLREPCSRLLSHWLFWRQHTDAELAPWGGWADYARKSRKPLAEFISDPLLAGQTDNLMLRMLLWPHPLVPEDRFIDPVNDKRLLRAATERLLKFDFVDIVEDPAFVHRLESWLGRSFQYGLENATKPILGPFRSPLHRELTADAVDLLALRSRLDLRLWERVAARHIPDQDVARLREQTILANVARYGVLMAG